MVTINYNTGTIFAERGISNETLERYRVTAVTHLGRPALRYPTIGTGAVTGWRIKYIDGGDTKYTWAEHHPECTYYSAGGLVKAIAENDGLAYLVNGEAATWAFHTYQMALGKPADLAAPCISWFGEGSVPLTLSDDLKSFGVVRTYLLVDCDEAGYKAALKVLKHLGDVPCMPLELPFAFGSGSDFNDLWVKCEFDANKTAAAVLATKMLSVDEIKACAGIAEKPVTIETPFRETSPAKSSGDVDFPDMHREWVQTIINSLGAAEKHEGRVPRWTCPLPNHDDKHPSFTVDYKGKSPRPRCSCGIHDDDNAWEKVAAAKGLPTWIEYRTAQLASKKANEQKAQSSQQPAPVKRTLRKGSDVLKSLDSVLAGDTSAIGNPVLFPFRTMHYLGGLCRYIPAGMLVGVVGGSGEGKTSLVETFVDFWNRGGIDVVFYSPEWTSELIMQRRIQRYSGFNGNPHVTVDDFTALTLYYKERDLGIPENQRDGRMLSDGQKQAYEDTKKKLLAWKGETLIACDDDPTQPLYLETFLEMTADALADARRQKRRADVVAVDYLQLAEVLDDKRNEVMVNQVIRKIKQHATVHKYVGFDASQITKASSKTQKTGGGMVTSDDAQFLRSDKFNLMLTINRVFQDKEGDKVPMDLAHLYVDKNSLGRAKQKLLYRTDYLHLRWLDERIDEAMA